MAIELIETLRSDDAGGIPLLEGHMRRLAASAHALDYRCPLAAIREAVGQAAAALPRQPRRLRLLLAQGGSYSLQAATLEPLPALPGAALAASRLDSATPLLRHKTTDRRWYAAAGDWLAAHPDHFDVLFLNERGELCEGSRSNVYLKLDGQWRTPPVDSGLLPGVQRAALLDAGLVDVCVLYAADLQRAEGLRLSNALRGWFDVRLSALAAP